MASVPYQTLFFGLGIWEGAEIEIDPVAGTAETWAYDTEIGTASATPREVVENIATWTQSGSRNWSGSWSASATYLDAGDAGLRLGLDGGVAGTVWTINSALGTPMGWLTTTDDAITSSAGASGTVQTATIWLSRWLRTVSVEGPRSGSGSWHGAHFGSQPHTPSLRWLMDEEQCARLWEQLTSGDVATPREVEAYDDINSEWRKLQLAALGRREPSLTHYKFEPSVVEAQ